MLRDEIHQSNRLFLCPFVDEQAQITGEQLDGAAGNGVRLLPYSLLEPGV
jgi:hypothetical protein